MDIIASAERWFRELEDASSPIEIQNAALKTIAASLLVLAKEAEAIRRNVIVRNSRHKA